MLASLSVALAFMTFVFFLAQLKEDNGIVDIAWGLGIILLALFTFYKYSSYQPRQVLITLLAVLWGLRLAVYVYFRKRGKGENLRYKKWRKNWGDSFVIKSFLHIFFLQGIFMVIVSLPVLVTNFHYGSDKLGLWDNLGVLIWSFGFIMETMSDLQLSRFKRNPDNKGKILTSGLWKYSRHPNYFGEATMWWGMFMVAFSAPFGEFTLLSPLLITLLLLFVSGIPPLEKRYSNHDEYQKYAGKTSKFIPWFSKN